jgi:hypothetical protein
MLKARQDVSQKHCHKSETTPFYMDGVFVSLDLLAPHYFNPVIPGGYQREKNALV